MNISTKENISDYNSQKDVDNDVQFEYIRNKMMFERFPTYSYYMAIKKVTDQIVPEPECKYLKLLNLE
jgi:hypothetical protein